MIVLYMLQSATTWDRCTRSVSHLLAEMAATHARVCQAGRWSVPSTHAIQVANTWAAHMPLGTYLVKETAVTSALA